MPARHQQNTEYIIYTYKYTVSVLYIHKNGEMGNIQHKLRTNPTRRPHSHSGSHPASSAPSETGARKRSTFTSANIFLQKTIFYVYILCVSCVSVSSVFPVSANSLKKPKKVSITWHQSNPPQRWLPFRRAPVCWNPVWPELWVDHVFF